MQVKINVTARDIKLGKVSSIRTCPIALAIQRHVKDHVLVLVGSTSLELKSALRIYRFTYLALPPSAQGFIYDFDHACTTKPFRFTLDIHKHLLKSGA